MGHALAGDEAGRKLALVLEYDGTRYHGFQFQSNAPSIQEEVEVALFRLTAERVRVKAAGRTDAGVHAAGQVVALVTRTNYAAEAFQRALNHYLPRDIAVRAAREVEGGFDPRRHARSRVYRYTILNRRARSPFWERFAHHVVEPLDTEAMGRALGYLQGGPRDFAPFSGPLGGVRTTVRRLLRTDVRRRGDLVLVEMEGNAFLPQQVRRTAGALVRVGVGQMREEEFRALADCGSLGAARWVAPPQGLCLVRVRYARSGLKDHGDGDNNNEDI